MAEASAKSEKMPVYKVPYAAFVAVCGKCFGQYPVPDCPAAHRTRQLRKPLQALTETALKQINDREYDTELKARGVEMVYKYGIAFSRKNVEIARFLLHLQICLVELAYSSSAKKSLSILFTS